MRNNLFPDSLVFVFIVLLSLASFNCPAQTLWGVSEDNEGAVYNFDLKSKQFTLVHSFAKKKNATGSGNEGLNSDGRPMMSKWELGTKPLGVLMKGDDEYVYGITNHGGESGCGVIFRIDTLDLSYEELYSLAGFTVNGNPVMIDSMIYVTANLFNSKGAVIGYCVNSNLVDTVYKTDNSFWYYTSSSPGNNNTILVADYIIKRVDPKEKSVTNVCSTPTMASYGMGTINELPDGDFFFSSAYAGSAEAGVILKYSPSPPALTNVYTTYYVTGANSILGPMNSFVVDGSDNPVGCDAWSAHDPGMIYKLEMDSDVVIEYPPIVNKKFVLLQQFNDSTGRVPSSDLLMTRHGLIYGTTSKGGRYDKGTIFSFDLKTNGITKLLDFNDVSGSFPLFGHLMITNDYPAIGIDVPEDSIVKLFPNPAKEHFTIRMTKAGNEDHHLYLRDLQGKTIINGILLTNGDNIVGIEKLPAGIYIACVTSPESSKSYKLVKL